MAKKKQTVMVGVVAPDNASKVPAVDSYQVREDCSDIMRHAALRKDKERYARAMDLMRGAIECDSREDKPRKSGRGRRSNSRNMGKR